MKFSRKNIENWQSWKMSFFLVGHFEFFSLSIIFFEILMITSLKQPFYTILHTTVCTMYREKGPSQSM